MSRRVWLLQSSIGACQQAAFKPPCLRPKLLVFRRSLVFGWTVAEAAKAFGQQRDTPKLLASFAIVSCLTWGRGIGEHDVSGNLPLEPGG